MKLEDIPFVIHDIQKEMPLLTDSLTKIPHNYSPFPKNLKEYANKVNEKYLNNHLATIEEIAHRFPNHGLPSWIKNYQVRKFQAHLGKDGFFKYIGESGYMEGTRFRQHTNPFIEFVKVLGQEITVGDTTGGLAGVGSNLIIGMKNTSGVVGTYYDQIALNINNLSAVGSVRLGLYSDNSGVPHTVLGQDGGNAVASNAFTYRSFTEVALTTTSIWLVFNTSANNATGTYYYNSTTNGKHGSFTYGTLTNDPSMPTADALYNMKVGHS